jgi:hypothetical protein
MPQRILFVSFIQSLLAQNEIDDPAAPDVRPRPPAVGEDVDIGAARFFKTVCQDRQVIEAAVVLRVRVKPRVERLAPQLFGHPTG